MTKLGRRINLTFALLAFFTVAGPIKAVRVVPPIELSDFIASMLPSADVDFDHIEWDYQVNSPAIIWQTSGVETSTTMMSSRSGLVRVVVDWHATQVLQKKWDDIPWTVRLVTKEPAKFGPKYIEITPGGGKHLMVYQRSGGSGGDSS